MESKLIIYQNKFERHVNRDIANQFNNYQTDNPEPQEPMSLHGHFYLPRKKVRVILECMTQSGCKVTRDMKVDAAN